jgi:hypothetical protein
MPADPDRRLEALVRFARSFSCPSEKARDFLKRYYGDGRGVSVVNAETFETCEYGAEMDGDAIRRLFQIPQ